MARIGEWFRRILYLLNRGRLEAALEEEMNAHRAMMGEPARFGHTLQLRERARDVWGWNWLDGTVRDLRFATRGLRRTPVFTIVVTLSLALGFALTATVVSVVNAYLLRTLPYPAVDRLYHVRYAPPGPWEPRGMTDLDWASVQDVVEFPIASSGESFYLGDDGYTMVLRGLRVSRGFSDGLGVSVVAGRRLSAADFAAGAEPVALIGHALWRDRFAASPGAMGRLLRTESESRPGGAESFRIVGVLAPDFYYGRESRTAVNLYGGALCPNPDLHGPAARGDSTKAAEHRLTDAVRLAATSPIPSDWPGVRLESVHERDGGSLQPVFIGLTVAVGARAGHRLRQRRGADAAARHAASEGRRCSSGAWRDALRRRADDSRGDLAHCRDRAGRRRRRDDRGPGQPVTAGRGATWPAGATRWRHRDRWDDAGGRGRHWRRDGGVDFARAHAGVEPSLMNALQQQGRGASDGPAMRRIRHGLIVFEIAGSLVLLVGCGLMIRSVSQMIKIDLGFQPRRDAAVARHAEERQVSRPGLL